MLAQRAVADGDLHPDGDRVREQEVVATEDVGQLGERELALEDELALDVQAAAASVLAGKVVKEAETYQRSQS